MKRRSDIVFQAPQKRPRVLDDDEDTGSDDSDAGYELRQIDQSSDDEIPTKELNSISRFKEKGPSQPSPAPTAATSKHTSFSDLGISRILQAALTSMSIRMPTEVQAACIPPLLSGATLVIFYLLACSQVSGRDCIGNAKTGSGKTITFALPILQKLAVDPYGLFALVLTPTRSVRCAYSVLAFSYLP